MLTDLVVLALSAFAAGFIVGSAVVFVRLTKLPARPKLPHRPDVWNDFQGELVRRRAAQREGREVLRVVLQGKQRGGW